VHRTSLGGIEVAGGTPRIDAGSPKCLVRVDVPEAGKRSLIEKRSLDRSPSTSEPLFQLG